MKKVLNTFSLTVICLFILSVFGWMVFHISSGDKNFGFIEGPVKFMYSFPDLFFQSVEEVKTLPPTFIPTPADFQSVNNLDYDLHVLSTYSDRRKKRSIVLLNLKNDSVLYKWTVKNPYPEHARILNPLLFPDRSIVYGYEGTSGLMRIDSLANIMWRQDTVKPHHSMTLDRNGDIWICSFVPVFYATGLYQLNGRRMFFIDNYITLVDAETGRIIFHKSVTEILTENHLSGYLLKSSQVRDPLHINDAEPALKTTPYYDADDVFISVKNISMIMHYRPSTNKIIDIIEGPFTGQHDVDFLNDSTLVIFNNNYYVLADNASKKPPPDSTNLKFAGEFYSNIIRYDFGEKSLSFMGDSVFRANKIFTYTEGLIEFIDPSTYLVEEQNTGLIWILKDDEVLYKNVLNSQHEGYHHLPNWIRIIK